MRGLLLVAGSLAMVIAMLLFLFGAEHRGEALSLLVVGMIGLGAAGVIDAITDSADRIEQALAARDRPSTSEHKPKPAIAPVAATVDSPAAAELLKRAETLHFAKKFDAAIEIYRDIVASHPDSKQAAKARQQLENLERA